MRNASVLIRFGSVWLLVVVYGKEEVEEDDEEEDDDDSSSFVSFNEESVDDDDGAVSRWCFISSSKDYKTSKIVIKSKVRTNNNNNNDRSSLTMHIQVCSVYIHIHIQWRPCQTRWHQALVSIRRYHYYYTVPSTAYCIYLSAPNSNVLILLQQHHTNWMF